MLSTIGIIIDVVLVAILVIFGIIGFKKGLFKSLLSLFSWVVCIAVAIFTAKYVAGWINGIYDFNSLIGAQIEKGLAGMGDVFSQKVNEFESKDAILVAIANVPNINGALLQLIKILFTNAAFDATSTATVGNLVGVSIGQMCMVVISAILVFIVLKIVIALLSKLFDNISRIKIIGGLNKIFGLLFGLIKGVCIIFIFNAVLVALSMIPAVNNTITPVIQDNTKIEKVIYNTTDKLVGKYIIDGNVIQNWITDLWNSRG